MPIAALKSVREVSSEDKLHSASNLLQHEATRKWKTGEPGEKSAYVIIEMEKDYTIKGIDIGNECSAFVEVLVGNSTCARDKFKEILITCSFMTPVESRTCSMPNRVRCFGREALVKEIASEKWKLLKIVCSQPFNKDIKYGLSFIKVHVEDLAKAKNRSGSNGSSIFGNFSLRENSPDSESESATGLFNRWKNARNKQLDGISSVPRNPSPASLKKTNECLIIKKTPSTAASSTSKDAAEESTPVHDRNRNSLLFTDDDENDQSFQEKRKKKLEKLEKAIAADQERVTKETEKGKKPKTQDNVKSELKKSKENEKEKLTPTPKNFKQQNTPSTSGQRRPSSSPGASSKPKKPKTEHPLRYKPFNQLLNGVVLVISGIQNPDRADLRNKALALGAKYKADWDSSSTHLICAFKNTPKYNQVKGVGKIVTRKWIEDCHNKRKKIPWRRYALDSDELSKAESEDEIVDESLKPTPEDDEPDEIKQKNSDNSDDVLTKYDKIEINNSQCTSGSDTEDEIQKVLAKKKTTSNRDVFEVSTEEEEYVSKGKEEKLNVPAKTSFFKGMKFFVNDKLGATMKIKLNNYIELFEGVLTTSMDEANYIITENRIEDVQGFKGETVTPLWILECNDSECLISTKRYLVQ